MFVSSTSQCGVDTLHRAAVPALSLNSGEVSWRRVTRCHILASLLSLLARPCRAVFLPFRISLPNPSKSRCPGYFHISAVASRGRGRGSRTERSRKCANNSPSTGRASLRLRDRTTAVALSMILLFCRETRHRLRGHGRIALRWKPCLLC